MVTVRLRVLAYITGVSETTLAGVADNKNGIIAPVADIAIVTHILCDLCNAYLFFSDVNILYIFFMLISPNIFDALKKYCSNNV